MDTLLTRRWLADAPFRSIVDQASISVARDDVRSLATSLDFATTTVGELALIVSELATNQLRHGRMGRIALLTLERDGVSGIEIVAYDRGEGIADPTGAVRGAERSQGSLGVGVSSVLRLADEVDFDVRAREGTCVRARKFSRSVGRRREVAVLGRPFEGERLSGDDAWFGRRGARLILALADGLGHGPDAREAASRAIEVVVATDAPPSELCLLASTAAEKTRGTVLTIVEIDESTRTLTMSGGGNVLTHVVGPRGTRAFSTVATVLGKTPRLRSFPEERTDLEAQDLVLLFTDGISSRARLDLRDGVFREPALAVGDHMLRSFGRTNDDATIVVAR